jgi:hypothetical protein
MKSLAIKHRQPLPMVKPTMAQYYFDVDLATRLTKGTMASIRVMNVLRQAYELQYGKNSVQYKWADDIHLALCFCMIDYTNRLIVLGINLSEVKLER